RSFSSPWRSAMSLPRELTARRVPEGWHLAQRPARELEKLRAGHHHLGGASVERANDWLAKLKVKGPLLEIKAEFAASDAADFGVNIASAPGEEIALRRSSDGRLSL